MEKTGDLPWPVEDRARLDAAVMNLWMAAYYEDADLIQQAAMLP